MNLQELQKRAKKLDINDTLKNLIGHDVPVSNFEKLKVLDVNVDEFKFERNLTNEETSFFTEWLKGEIQNGVRKELGV